MPISSVGALRRAMRACEQTPGMSVFEHGLQVARYFRDLQQHVMEGKPLRYEWKLPEWAYSAELWQRLVPTDHIMQYQIYHDCGKPFCRTVDEQGRAHFPDHAKVSAGLWRDLGQSDLEADLIAKDMDAHLLKDEGVSDFCASPLAATLLLTALSEIHANAAMFGGLDSISFKMKYKQLSRRGKAIVANLQRTNSNQTTLTQSLHNEVHYA